MDESTTPIEIESKPVAADLFKDLTIDIISSAFVGAKNSDLATTLTHRYR